MLNTQTFTLAVIISVAQATELKSMLEDGYGSKHEPGKVAKVFVEGSNDGSYAGVASFVSKDDRDKGGFGNKGHGNNGGYGGGPVMQFAQNNFGHGGNGGHGGHGGNGGYGGNNNGHGSFGGNGGYGQGPVQNF